VVFRGAVVFFLADDVRGFGVSANDVEIDGRIASSTGAAGGIQSGG
jgi:hypothetical protein